MNAIVFAYHNIGVQCLKVLLARNIRVTLVITHMDNPYENIWFNSVINLCNEYCIPYIAIAEQKLSQLLLYKIQVAQPDFIFSFYYRNILPIKLLTMAKYGAYNMHGSLLPKYRGRAPVNWAILHGETETGVTLHEMIEKPDAGPIIVQTKVPILPNDTAYEVFNKIIVAAEQTLWNILPLMIKGLIPKLFNDISHGNYFCARNEKDGRINWKETAQCIHNLVRAVAPPYPGAFEEISGDKITFIKTRLVTPLIQSIFQKSSIYNHLNKFYNKGNLYVRCGDNNYLQILQIQINNKNVDLKYYMQYLTI